MWLLYEILRVDGVNAVELTKKIRSHAATAPPAALPAAPKVGSYRIYLLQNSTLRLYPFAQEDLDTRLKRLISAHKCMLFMKVGSTFRTSLNIFSVRVVFENIIWFLLLPTDSLWYSRVNLRSLSVGSAKQLLASSRTLRQIMAPLTYSMTTRFVFLLLFWINIILFRCARVWRAFPTGQHTPSYT